MGNSQNRPSILSESKSHIDFDEDFEHDADQVLRSTKGNKKSYHSSEEISASRIESFEIEDVI